MLSPLNIVNTEIVAYSSGAPPFNNQRLNFPDNAPRNFAWINSTITAGAGILLPGFFIYDETGTPIFQVGIIPWQFAGTTVTITTMQTPEPPRVALFGTTTISGFIPADLHVFDGWSIEFGGLGADALTSAEAIFGFNL